MHVGEVDHFMVLVHPPGDKLVSLSKIFSRDIVLVSAVEDSVQEKYRHSSYDIEHKRNTMLANSHNPCSHEKQNAYDCIERYIQSEANCYLPWRNESRGAYEAPCKDAAKFKEVNLNLMTAGEEQIYARTGCRKSCDFMVLSPCIKKDEKIL